MTTKEVIRGDVRRPKSHAPARIGGAAGTPSARYRQASVVPVNGSPPSTPSHATHAAKVSGSRSTGMTRPPRIRRRPLSSRPEHEPGPAGPARDQGSNPGRAASRAAHNTMAGDTWPLPMSIPYRTSQTSLRGEHEHPPASGQVGTPTPRPPNTGAREPFGVEEVQHLLTTALNPCDGLSTMLAMLLNAVRFLTAKGMVRHIPGGHGPDDVHRRRDRGMAMDLATKVFGVGQLVGHTAVRRGREGGGDGERPERLTLGVIGQPSGIEIGPPVRFPDLSARTWEMGDWHGAAFRSSRGWPAARRARAGGMTDVVGTVCGCILRPLAMPADGPGVPLGPGDGNARIRVFESGPSRWWSCGESNPGPLRCERSALPTALQPHGLGGYRSRDYFSSAADPLAPLPGGAGKARRQADIHGSRSRRLPTRI